MGSLWAKSGTIERFGADDLRAAGAQAFFFQGGTTTPLTVFEDGGEASPHEHPVEADSNGRWPAVFVPYTLSYDVQVITAEGEQLFYFQEIPNPDPVELTVEPPETGAVETGMVHLEIIDAVKTGYVRLNGRTIGNASSSGTERANADTEALFTYLWNGLSDTIAPVSSGRGASAAADFSANKTITLPDLRGRAPVGLDTMGNSAGSNFTGITFDLGSATVPGSKAGANTKTLALENLPSHTHTGTTSSNGSHAHQYNEAVNGGGGVATPGAGVFVDHIEGNALTQTVGAHTHTFTTNAAGSGTSLPTLPKSILVTWYIKL